MREMGIHLHSTAIMIYPCSRFHIIVNEISQNETKNCPSRLTAVEVWGIPANDTVLLTAVRREKFAKNKKNTSKERLSLLLFKL